MNATTETLSAGSKAAADVAALLRARNPAMFRVDSATDYTDHNRGVMIFANRDDDPEICAWLYDAKIGDVYDDGNGERVERIA